MLKRFDLKYNEINAEELFGKSTQTINTAVKNLEKRYFKGRNLFRNNTATSDLLFRWEIKNLLLLLIKLEIDNVFSGGKSSKEGVTDLSIKKILASYDYVNNDNNLRDYEKWVLEQSFSAVSSKEFVEDINEFEKVLTNFWVLAAKYYEYMPSDYFKRISAVLNSFSRGIIDHALKYEAYQKRKLPKIVIDQYHGTSTLRERPLRINLETAVVTAINTISEALYDFDENGCCHRKKKLEASDVFNDSYQIIHSRHSLSDEELSEYEFDVDDIRSKVDELMEDYWAEEVKIPHKESEDNEQSQTSGFYTHNSKEKIDVSIHNLKILTLYYIEHYCAIKSFVSGHIDRKQLEENCSGETAFKQYEELREQLLSFKLADHPFFNTLSKIEKEAWSTVVDYPKGKVPDDKKFDSIINRHIDIFRKETDLIRNQAIKEFDDITNRNLDGDILSGVTNNIDNISSDSDDIIKNMLSMVLKIEADNDKQPL